MYPVLRQIHSPPKASSPHSASFFNFQYHLFSWRLPSSCLSILPRLSIPSIPPSTFPSIIWFRRHFLRKMNPIQLAFHLFNACMTFLSFLTLYNISPFLTRLVKLIFFILLQHHISKFCRYFWSTFQSVQVSTKLCFKRITSLVYSSNLSPIYW